MQNSNDKSDVVGETSCVAGNDMVVADTLTKHSTTIEARIAKQ